MTGWRQYASSCLPSYRYILGKYCFLKVNAPISRCQTDGVQRCVHGRLFRCHIRQRLMTIAASEKLNPSESRPKNINIDSVYS